jgi:aspartate aminotransferase
MAALNQKMVGLGTQRSVIRELFEFGKKRMAEVGPENVFDFSIGNPSVPAPDSVNETVMRMTREMDSVVLHGYTSAQGDPLVRKKVADSIRRNFDFEVSPDSLYMTYGAASALCCCLNALNVPGAGDEFIVFAPYFPEYQVFIEAAGGVFRLIPADIEEFQIDFDRFEETLNEKTKAVLIMENDRVVLSALLPETIRVRAQGGKEEAAGSEDV